MSYDKSNMKAIILFVIELVETRVTINEDKDIGKQLRNNINSLKRISLTNFSNYEEDSKVIQKNLAVTIYLYEQHIKQVEKNKGNLFMYLSSSLFIIMSIIMFLIK